MIAPITQHPALNDGHHMGNDWRLHKLTGSWMDSGVRDPLRGTRMYAATDAKGCIWSVDLDRSALNVRAVELDAADGFYRLWDRAASEYIGGVDLASGPAVITNDLLHWPGAASGCGFMIE